MTSTLTISVSVVMPQILSVALSCAPRLKFSRVGFAENFLVSVLFEKFESIRSIFFLVMLNVYASASRRVLLPSSDFKLVNKMIFLPLFSSSNLNFLKLSTNVLLEELSDSPLDKSKLSLMDFLRRSILLTTVNSFNLVSRWKIDGLRSDGSRNSRTMIIRQTIMNMDIADTPTIMVRW